MSLNVIFERLRSYDSQDIGFLEDNVASALEQLGNVAAPLLRPTNKQATSYTAVLDDEVVVAGTVTVALPVATRSNAGRRVGIVLQSGTATVKTASGTVQGAATDTLTAVGRYEYESDGAGGWWRQAASGGGIALTDFIQNLGRGTGGHFTVSGAGFTTGKDVLVTQTAAAIPSKGDARDEIEMDAIELTGYVVNATTIQVYWHATGIVVGDYAFAYQVSA